MAPTACRRRPEEGRERTLIAPTLGGMRLGRAGAAFELAKPAMSSTIVRLGAWTIETTKDLRLVVARGRATSYESATRAARERVESALDLLSVRGIDDARLSRPSTEHVAWWTRADGLTIRIVSWRRLSVGISARAVVRGPDGRIRRDSRPPDPKWHPSYRFFRLSQTTTNLFDAYRNAYLALESLLSDVAPQRRKAKGTKGEQEGDWFRRALLESGVDLSPFVDPAISDPVDELYDRLYRRLRVRVFHAKPDRDLLLPLHHATRTQVQEGLALAWRLYLSIVEARLGLSRLGGGISLHAARVMGGSVLDSLEVAVNADETGLDAPAPESDNEFAPTARLPHQDPVDYTVPFAASRLAWGDIDRLSELPFVRKAVGLGPSGSERMVTRLEGRLVPHGARRLEVDFGLAFRYARALQDEYD